MPILTKFGESQPGTAISKSDR